MQAIILAAGMGKRLGELTSSNTKCMVEVNGTRLIDRLLGQLSELSLNRVVIVVGYEADKLIEHIGDRYSDRLKIEYVRNDIYYKTNNIYSLALAKHLLVEDDTLLIESDLIFEDKLFSLILNNPYPNLALVAKYQTWMDGTMVRIDDDCNIVNFVPKKAFKYSDIDHYYKTVNIYKFSKEFLSNKYIPFLDAYCSALGNNEYYEQVLRVICMLENSELKALPINNERWYEIDDIQDLNIAEAIFADGDEKLAKYNCRYGGYWRFHNMLDFCYLVNPYYPSPRMKDEMKANFDVLLTQYPSGLVINSLLASKCFGVKKEHIVPGNGAAEIIRSLMNSLGGKIGVTYPTFEEYPNRVAAERLEIFTPSDKDFSYTADDLISHFTEHPVDILLVINPDNPSGNELTKEELLKLAQWSKERQMTFIVDESFCDFSDAFPHNTILDDHILEQYSNLIVIKSISKSFGVPGLRLGIMATSNVAILSDIRKDLSIWNINSFAEFFMQIYSKYTSDYSAAAEKFRKERQRFFNALQEITFLRIIPSQANYFLCEVLPPYTSHGITMSLLKQADILIKDCSGKKGFNGKNYIRLAIRDRMDNNSLIEALKRL